MNLLQQLDAAYPGWREEISREPIEAAIELGLLEPDDMEGDELALDFTDERANWQRYLESMEDE